MPDGGNPDYSSLSTWESASDLNLDGYSGPVILDCYDSQIHEEGTIPIAGCINTTPTVYRHIRSAASCLIPWAGKSGTGANFHSTANGDSSFQLNEDYARISEIYVFAEANVLTQASAINIGGSKTGCKILNCVAKATNAGAGGGVGIWAQYTGVDNLIFNCIANDCKTDGFWLKTFPGSVRNSVVCCTALRNGVFGFEAAGTSAALVVFSCYAADNGYNDFEESNEWDAPSGWNASKDATADLGGYAGDNYKNNIDLIATNKMDSDGLALSDDLFANGNAGDRYGRNPYNDFTGTTDCYDFFKNDTDGEPVSKKDIQGIGRPAPDIADTSWNVGASENFSAKLYYRTGATAELCAAATYIRYILPFDSEGFVQLRVEE